MSTSEAREFSFSDGDFDAIRGLVGSHTGIKLSGEKRELVYGRLSRRLRALDLSSFSQYRDLLASGDGELEHLINAITTNLTSFFRESHHFEFLARSAIPEIEERNIATRRMRIWSAGCSSGEEPYSIAMTLAESFPALASWNVRVLATDLDSNVVESGARGVYPAARIDSVDSLRLARWFVRGTGENVGKVKVSDRLREMIVFRRLNLMDSWPVRGPFDVIFCRNVIIYFDKDTQRTLINRYAELLPIGGYLFVGHSESLFKVTARFSLVEKTIYRKVA